VTHRVYSRDPQAKAHGRIRSATSSLTQDAALGAKVDDLFNDQEIKVLFKDDTAKTAVGEVESI